MDIFMVPENCKGEDITDPMNGNGQKDIFVQLVISSFLGLSSFLAFCILRPRWKSLYAARKRQVDAASDLPDLPNSFFGWIPVLYKVTEQQVLESAGLDAYVFLTFFKMSIKLLTILFILAATVLAPINSHYLGLLPPLGNGTGNGTSSMGYQTALHSIRGDHKRKDPSDDISFLWAYLVFTYLFTALAIYFIITETTNIIRVRQDYLGSQSTITDRTIRLSGIPGDLRSEENIKAIIEKLEIGSVECVTLCRDWKEIDQLMEKRARIIRKLEEAWAKYIGSQSAKHNPKLQSSTGLASANAQNDHDEDEEANPDETGSLLPGSINQVRAYEQPRPKMKIRFGFCSLQSRKVDAIDYYEERMRTLDEKVKEARKKEYKPTPLAFVTLDSIPAAQMALQALIDPTPTHLVAKIAPAPSDIVWSNTYLPRSTRMMRSWSISIFIAVLSIFWLIPVAPFASLLNLCSIKFVWPELGDLLERHEILASLVQTGLPTVVVSILNIAVPFLYDYLSNLQGMISQSDVELSVISKNFLFSFFNIFLVFTAFGTATDIWPVLQDTLQDTTKIAYHLAQSLGRLGGFYTNFIMLQGIGLFPLRLLEFGSVTLYPIMKLWARTPRDYAELNQPPIFKYGFYLPTSLLVLILCIVYSVLQAGYQVLFFGLLYFIIGFFVYKYQLLYAMDHPQHATGGAWTMICYRIMVGLGIFQVAMAGVIALRKLFLAAVLIIPLMLFTIWFRYYYGRTYEPLTKYIALRSIRREDDPEINIADEDIGIHRPPGHIRRVSVTVDENREKGQIFVNPSLVSPLENAWRDGEQPDQVASNASSESLGDTHVWRENGDRNV